MPSACKPTNKKELLDEIRGERATLEALLESIPDNKKKLEVCDGMSVKDFLAHRAEWVVMMLRWYQEAKGGGEPAVPHEDYKWSQLPELNASIQKTYAKASLKKMEAFFSDSHDALFQLVSGISTQELYTKGFYPFTNSRTRSPSTNLAAYINLATAAHYRSAAKHIRKWAKSQAQASAAH